MVALPQQGFTPPASWFATKYGAGRFPFGRCGSVYRGDIALGTDETEPCKNAACHRLPHKQGLEKRVCRFHLPAGTLFAPFMGQQERMYYSKARWVLGGGGAGGAKTHMGSRLWLKQYFVEKARFDRGEIRASKGWCLFVRRTMPEVQQVIAEFETYYRSIDPEAKRDAKYSIYTFPSAGGLRVQFGGMEDDDDWHRYWGGQYTQFVADEAVELTYTQIKKVDLRVRTDDPVLKGMLQTYLLTNPINGAYDRLERIYTHEYFKTQYVDPHPSGNKAVLVKSQLDDGRVIAKKQVYIPASLYDNPALADDGDYEASIKTHSEAVQRALLYCDWNIAEGAWVGNDWDPKVHIVAPFTIPDNWYRFKCGDYGYDARSSILWVAVDPDENFWVYRSLSTRLVTARELGIVIKTLESEPLIIDGVQIIGPERDPDGISTVWGPMDTELWARRGESGPSRAEELNATGAGFVKCDKNPDSAAEQIRNRLRRRGKNLFGGECAGLQFFSNCYSRVRSNRGAWQLTGPIQTIPVCPRDTAHPDRWDTKADDHDLDALGYGCLSRPLAGTVVSTLERAQQIAWESYVMRKGDDEDGAFRDWS